ncbi:hypothetical protein [uncultured Prevotella sp.]|uniref:hypothetical protein n=1 Tax=uncultured Prevotella sp. TaxID=159272 RepID=UPI00259ACF6A|nr:hypothetical protein [uncultured Prevotella sp.]
MIIKAKPFIKWVDGKIYIIRILIVPDSIQLKTRQATTISCFLSRIGFNVLGAIGIMARTGRIWRDLSSLNAVFFLEDTGGRKLLK